MSRKNQSDFKAKRKALEILAQQGALSCDKHDCQVTVGMMYGKRCYTGRNRGNDICPYLQINTPSEDYGCRRKK